MKVSIIIPTLNEAEGISAQVGRCVTLSPPPEVIVADGQSEDSTAARALIAGARVLRCSRRGRAVQMNAAAAIASGDVLLFLHADVVLPPASYGSLLAALRDPGLAGGAFRRDFDSSSVLLSLGARLAALRGHLLKIFLGDQAIFARRLIFQELGGFPEIPLFEDFAFSRRLARWGRTRLISPPVIASSRRFDREGTLRGLAGNVGLTVLYLLGANPRWLARLYDRRSGDPSGSRVAAASARPLRGRP